MQALQSCPQFPNHLPALINKIKDQHNKAQEGESDAYEYE